MLKILSKLSIAMFCAFVATIFNSPPVNIYNMEPAVAVEKDEVVVDAITTIIASVAEPSVTTVTTSVTPTTTKIYVPTTTIRVPVTVAATTTIRVPVTVAYVETDYDRWMDEHKDSICYADEVCESIYVMPTLRELVREYFREEDWPWAFDIAFCESSGQPDDRWSTAMHKTTNASGWFQHLPKYWEERSVKAGFSGFHIMDPRGNVGVAAWLFYRGGGQKHWECAKHEHN
jgi:hypothetical protein